MRNRHGLPELKLPECSLAELRAETYNNDVGNLDKVDGYDCPACKNKGWIAVIREEDGEDVFRRCECIEIRKTLKLAKAGGLDAVIRDKTFDTFELLDESYEDVIHKAKNYAADPQGWFYLRGQSGTGKTHICTAIVGEIIKKGVPCKYMLWREEAPVLKAHVNSEDYGKLISPYKKAKCLYIDDLFKGGVTQADLNLAFEIINHRSLNRELLTIFSTERDITEILEMDEAIGGRIYEKTNIENMIDVSSWENYRLRK